VSVNPELFALRGELPPRTKTVIELTGLAAILLIWFTVVKTGLVPSRMLPSPDAVIISYGELFGQDHLVRNLLFSLMINVLGYIEAVVIAIPLGYLIGLLPIPRALCERWVTAGRFLPLSALVGIFILWFGMYTNMKVQFLTLGIVVYLLPMVILRIDNVDQIYVDTVKTLGASKWQTVKTVFIPMAMSKISEDIRVIVAISWTYIIIAEVVNRTQGGIGALCYSSSRAARPDKVFAILALIILVGIVQDKVFGFLDKLFFKHKYV